MSKPTTKDKQAVSLAGLLAPYARRVEADLSAWLVEDHTPEPLAEALRYCALGGGKRLRPALVLLAAEACGGDADDPCARRAAVAVELVHAYSLVHDDLPAMDDDTLRRGRPTAHVKFGQALAILVGDALLTRAFAVLADCDETRSGPLAAELAGGAGSAGMIAGQVADMGLCAVGDDADGLRYIHLHKTAALIRAAMRMGGLCAAAPAETLDALGRYGEAIGLAFQMIDDLLDATGTAEQVGKATGKDAAGGKRTAAALLGINRTRQAAADLSRQAAAAVEPLGPRARPLVRLAEQLLQRTY